MSAPPPTIDSQRLRRLLDGVNAFGRNPETGGFNRVGFSDADTAVRRWFAETMARDGLTVRTDAAGNVFGRLGPQGLPCVMAGSHLDTVPEGGAFDGALGACVALECVRAIRDAGLRPEVPLEVVATAEEEGRFGGMLGSQAITGAVTAEWVAAARDAAGVGLGEAMAAQGLDPASVTAAAWPKGSIRAFLEVHIEQGPVLEAEGRAVGLVEAIAGVSWLGVRLLGRANHSGTTPMDLRADAFAGLAEAAGAIPRIIRDHGGPQTRVTIGKVDLAPNSPHTIPGRAEFSVILRDTDEAVMRALDDAMRGAVTAAAARHGLETHFEARSWLAPVALDGGLRSLLREEGTRLGLDACEMPSGAGHDAQTMQGICPAALVFVPSRDGISHAPEEWTDWGDIERGAALMLAALVRLSGAA